jgi:hypothetical protein
MREQWKRKRLRNMSKWEKQLEKLINGKQVNVTLAEYRWLETHGYELNESNQASNKGYYVTLKK